MKFNESPYVIADALVGMSEEDSLSLLRGVRDACLADTDWTQLPDVSLTAEVKLAWAEYRQQLRDVTSLFTGSLDDFDFPDKPALQ
jgi:hypothetical protein